MFSSLVAVARKGSVLDSSENGAVKWRGIFLVNFANTQSAVGGLVVDPEFCRTLQHQSLVASCDFEIPGRSICQSKAAKAREADYRRLKQDPS